MADCTVPHVISVRNSNTELLWIKKRDGGYHLGLYCKECGKWLAWLPQTAYSKQYAPPKPVEDLNA